MFGGLFSMAFKAIGGMTNSGSSACIKLFFDEPEMPKSMIEK